MAKIEFPSTLKALLDHSDLQAPLRILADRVGEILADNKLPFFPDYTDHGTDHVNQVLKSVAALVPKEVWERSKADSDPRLLCDADAVVIIGGTLLHDIAMHLRPDCFRELVSQGPRFQPLTWFSKSQEGHSADRPWHELWQDYLREARRFNDHTLINIVGQESVRQGWKFSNLPEDAGQWERNHCLVIGEFIRRHHARIAHEIAIYGFPGLAVGSGERQFPALGSSEEGHPLLRLADLIGLTARSHGTSLRVCKAYLDSSPLYQRTPRPMRTAVLFPMALLRVADYLQIDKQRAPAVLLQLRNPPSPISVQEWKKHLAVQSITDANDPCGTMVIVSPNLSLELYLHLRDLLAGLQSEMDHSSAVLDEAYGARTDLGLHQLSLAKRRLHSNLHSAAFRDSLPYVPERSGFTADPHLLTLLVEPLYGQSPGVGVRELVQNAVDAVRELHAWCAVYGKPIDALDLPEQAGDVLVQFIKRDDGSWIVRVQDKGIGMRIETIQNFFLRAGASLRQSPDWAKEFLDEGGRPRVVRAGRFGIGAFAVFLLGPIFRMWTRHAGAEKTMGYEMEASADSHLIEIRRIDGLPIGTTVEVELSSETIQAFHLNVDKYNGRWNVDSKTDWDRWDWPIVTRQVVRGPKTDSLHQEFSAPLGKTKRSPEWAMIRPKGFDAVFWSFSESPALVCNGLRIGAAEPRQGPKFIWPEETQLQCPNIAVLDNEANLPLTIQRNALSRRDLPFIRELSRDVTLSFIAHALVCGPASCISTHADGPHHGQHPLINSKCYHGGYPLDTSKPIRDTEPLLHWCSTRLEFVAIDPWLYSLLKILLGLWDH